MVTNSNSFEFSIVQCHLARHIICCVQVMLKNANKEGRNIYFYDKEQVLRGSSTGMFSLAKDLLLEYVGNFYLQALLIKCGENISNNKFKYITLDKLCYYKYSHIYYLLHIFVSNEFCYGLILQFSLVFFPRSSWHIYFSLEVSITYQPTKQRCKILCSYSNQMCNIKLKIFRIPYPFSSPGCFFCRGILRLDWREQCTFSQSCSIIIGKTQAQRCITDPHIQLISQNYMGMGRIKLVISLSKNNTSDT